MFSDCVVSPALLMLINAMVTDYSRKKGHTVKHYYITASSRH